LERRSPGAVSVTLLAIRVAAMMNKTVSVVRRKTSTSILSFYRNNKGRVMENQLTMQMVPNLWRIFLLGSVKI
jgi:hypothetical protein